MRIFYDFSLLAKIWTLFFVNGSSIYREKVWELKQRCGLADALGGKTKKFKQKGYAVFVAFEGQCFISILVQGIWTVFQDCCAAVLAFYGQ